MDLINKIDNQAYKNSNKKKRDDKSRPLLAADGRMTDVLGCDCSL